MEIRDDDGSLLHWILMSTYDKAVREQVITWICEKPGLDRKSVETFLDALHKQFPNGPPAAPKPSLEVIVEYARRVGEASGKTVGQVLAESNVFGIRKKDG